MPEDFSGVISFVDRVAGDFERELVAVAKRLEREIVAIAAGYDQRGGRFLVNDANLGRLVDLQDQIHQAIVEAGYPDAVETYMGRLPDLRDEVLTAWHRIVPDVAFRAVDADAIAAIASADLDSFANIAEDGADILRRNLVQAVTAGRPFKEFTGELRDFLRGADDLVDKAGHGMFRHAATLAQTAMDELSRTMDAQLADVAGINRFRYVGGIIADTRPFCAELNGQVLTRKEIDALDNGQTGTGSVFIAGGGFNCRHRWLPVVD